MRHGTLFFRNYRSTLTEPSLQITAQPKRAMKNPWIKKNPLMSIWLSGANTIANSARGHATAAAKRQSATLMTQSTKQVTDFWMSAFTPKPASKKSRKRR